MHSTANTRLAAAFLAMGFPANPETKFTTGAIITIEFEDDSSPMTMDYYEGAWRNFDNWSLNHPADPFTYMYRVSAARDWIISRVIHGTHNINLALPVETYKTQNLNFSCCLVAQNHYLLKLDRNERAFHFAPDAGKLWPEYLEPRPDSAIDWQVKYLRNFDWLIRCIKNRNLMLDKRPAPCNHPANLKRDTYKREIAA